MASCTRAWRPSGRGSTASKAESTSLALAAIAPFNWSCGIWAIPATRPWGVLTTPDKLSDIMPHLMSHWGRLAPGRKPSSHRPLLAPNPSVLPAGLPQVPTFQAFHRPGRPGAGIHAQVGVAPPIPKGENGYVAAPH